MKCKLTVYNRLHIEAYSTEFDTENFNEDDYKDFYCKNSWMPRELKCDKENLTYSDLLSLYDIMDYFLAYSSHHNNDVFVVGYGLIDFSMLSPIYKKSLTYMNWRISPN